MIFRGKPLPAILNNDEFAPQTANKLQIVNPQITNKLYLCIDKFNNMLNTEDNYENL